MNESTVRKEGGVKRVHGFNKVSPQVNRSLGNDNNGSGNRWLRRCLGALCVIAVLSIVVYFTAEPVTRLIERPVASVMVEGDFRYISKARAMELISAEINEQFLQLDLMHLKAVLESEPWIERASLTRRWPDTLEVRIAEQQPIARWGDDGFLNRRGEIIKMVDAAMLDDLPLLQGSETQAARIMQQYQDLSQLLRPRNLEVIALKCDEKKAWQLTVNGDVDIVIGRDQVMEKMHRFVTVYDQVLNKVWNDVVAIDARYTNGIAVQWVPASEAENKYIKTM